jgi:thioredoxin 1
MMFGAPWCSPCKVIKPKFESMMNDTKLAYGYCNLEEAPALASKYNIMNLPTFVVFKGEEIIKMSVTSSETEVKKLVGIATGQN